MIQQKSLKNEENVDKMIGYYKKVYGCSLTKPGGDSVEQLSEHLDNIFQKMKEVQL